MARTQTPLEILARDHNWKMGSLRRTLCNIRAMESPEARDTAEFAWSGEWDYQITRYLHRKRMIQLFGSYIDMASWGNPSEIQTKLRIMLSAAAFAYEFQPNEEPLCSDGEFDEACKMVDVSIPTSRPDLDDFFRKEFDPSTGVWIHNHPELVKVEAYTNYLRRNRK